MFEPLKITAWLQTRVQTDGYLPLDSVLYYLVHREMIGEQIMTLPGQSTGGAGQHPLPLKQINSDTRQWFYACSFAQWPAHTEPWTDHWNKRFDLGLTHLIDWRGKKARVDIGSGRYKPYHMPVFGFIALSVSWYCVGDKVAIGRLLRFAFALGKKRSQGEGAVLRWDVESFPEDWSIYSSTGRLMRAIPTDDLKAPLYGLRPSYWNPKHQFPCRLPEVSIGATVDR